MSRSGCYVTDGTALFLVLQPLARGVVALENAGSLELLLMPAEQVGRLKRVRPLTDPPLGTSAPHPRPRRAHPLRALRTLL